MTFCWKYAQCTSVTHRASTSCSFIHIFFQIISKWSFVNRHNFNRLGYLFVFVVVSPVQFSNFVVFSLHIRSSTSLCRCINLVRPPIRVTSDPVISITWPQYANLSFSRNLRKTWDCALNLHPFYQFRVCKNVKSTKQVDRVFVVVVVRVCFFYFVVVCPVHCAIVIVVIISHWAPIAFPKKRMSDACKAKLRMSITQQAERQRKCHYTNRWYTSSDSCLRLRLRIIFFSSMHTNGWAQERGSQITRNLSVFQ